MRNIPKLILAAMLLICSLAYAQDAKEKEPSANERGSKKEEDKRFEERLRHIQKTAMKARDAELQKGVLQLQKEFPQKPEVYEFLAEVAAGAEPDVARQIARTVLDAKAASEEAKESVKALMTKMEAIGKPLDIKFTAADGREVDLSKLKDKVVLLDFWATWCGPCVREMPNVKSAYEKLHGKGFEIVGISLDQKKNQLEKFVTDEKIPWPQYFDGAGWGNKYARQYGITSIPAMWLIDKKGNLRDLEATEGLAEKVEKLLAEK